MCGGSTAAFGAVDLFVAGAGFDVAGAFLLARGLSTSPHQAARRLIQGQKSFARFDVRTAEDYADGRLGLLSLAFGFLIQAVAYAWSAHGNTQLSSTAWSYVGIVASGTASMLFVWLVQRRLHPRLRNRWLIEFARIDNYGYRHARPSGREIFAFGQILGSRPYRAEYGDPAAYARRVFKTDVRDPSQDHLTRPAEFQPYVPLDDEHGYVSEMPKRKTWRRPWR